MTTGALLLSLSSLTSGTALEHLQNIQKGTIQWLTVPATQVMADVEQKNIIADISMDYMIANINVDIYHADIDTTQIEADIKIQNLEPKL